MVLVISGDEGVFEFVKDALDANDPATGNPEAAAAKDPDDPAANCNADGECGTLRFFWRCLPVGEGDACPFQPPAETACAWFIAAGVMPPGNYSFSLSVSDSANAASAPVNASVVVTVLAGALPSPKQ